MLSEDERNRIRLEEVCRDEVRRDLEKAKQEAKGCKCKISEFLNSQLGLWLLGSVLLTGVGWAWTQFVTSEQKRERANKVYTEIAYRSMRAQEAYEKTLKGEGGHSPVADALRVHQMDGTNAVSAFLEFQSWSIDALLFELEIIGSKGDRTAAEELRKTLNEVVGPSAAKPDEHGKTRTIGARLQTVIERCRTQ